MLLFQAITNFYEAIMQSELYSIENGTLNLNDAFVKVASAIMQTLLNRGNFELGNKNDFQTRLNFFAESFRKNETHKDNNFPLNVYAYLAGLLTTICNKLNCDPDKDSDRKTMHATLEKLTENKIAIAIAGILKQEIEKAQMPYDLVKAYNMGQNLAPKLMQILQPPKIKASKQEIITIHIPSHRDENTFAGTIDPETDQLNRLNDLKPIDVRIAQQAGLNAMKFLQGYLQWGIPAAAVIETYEEVYGTALSLTPAQTSFIVGFFGGLTNLTSTLYPTENTSERARLILGLLKASAETVTLYGVFQEMGLRIAGMIKPGQWDVESNESLDFDFAMLITLPLLVGLISASPKFKKALEHSELLADFADRVKQLFACAYQPISQSHSQPSYLKRAGSASMNFLFTLASVYEVASIPIYLGLIAGVAPQNLVETLTPFFMEKGRFIVAGGAALVKGITHFTATGSHASHLSHVNHGINKALLACLLFGYAAHAVSATQDDYKQGSYSAMLMGVISAMLAIGLSLYFSYRLKTNQEMHNVTRLINNGVAFIRHEDNKELQTFEESSLISTNSNESKNESDATESLNQWLSQKAMEQKKPINITYLTDDTNNNHTKNNLVPEGERLIENPSSYGTFTLQHKS